jgi:hypothetical protein
MNLQSDIGHIIDYFKGKDEISAVYIFGSTVNGQEIDESDIDIAVMINDHLLRFSETLHPSCGHCDTEHGLSFSETPYYQNRQSASRQKQKAEVLRFCYN